MASHGVRTAEHDANGIVGMLKDHKDRLGGRKDRHKLIVDEGTCNIQRERCKG